MSAVTERLNERGVRWRGLTASPQFASLVILFIVLVAFSIANPNFLSPLNISNMMAFLPELGIMALAMTLLLTAGEFDLSVGAVFALGPVIVMLLAQNGRRRHRRRTAGRPRHLHRDRRHQRDHRHQDRHLVIPGDAVDAAGRARGRLYITQGFPLKAWNQPGFFVTLLAGSFDVGPFRLYTSLWWFIGLTLLSAYVLNYSKPGNWISAIGSNRNAAVARGVPADAVKIWLFILASVLSGLAGMISAFRISAASPVAGTGYELEVIAMVVVGGTALTGGRGTILGTIVGAFMLRAIRNGIVLIGVPGLAFNIFVGAIILVMLILHALIQKRSGRR